MGYTLLIELDNKDIDQFFADNRDGDNGYVIDVTVDQAWFWRSTDNDFIGPETFGPSDSRESAIARAESGRRNMCITVRGFVLIGNRRVVARKRTSLT